MASDPSRLCSSYIFATLTTYALFIKMTSSRGVVDQIKCALESNNNSELANLYEKLKVKVLGKNEEDHKSLLECGKLHQYRLGALESNSNVDDRLKSLQENLVALR